MSCVSPVTIKSEKGYSHVPCGKCGFCLRSKRAAWTFRIRQELKGCSSAMFLTLTYDSCNLTVSEDGEAVLNKRDVQLFMKRLRKAAAGCKLRYYFVGEYGGESGRPHYHAILFNFPVELYGELPAIWGLGHVVIGDASPASIHYVTKYVINSPSDELVDLRTKPFALISNGLGSGYLDKGAEHHKKNWQDYVVSDGFKMSLPRYYRDRIFSKYESEVLALRARKLSDERLRAEEALLEEKYGVLLGRLKLEGLESELKQVKSKLNKGSL